LRRAYYDKATLNHLNQTLQIADKERWVGDLNQPVAKPKGLVLANEIINFD
jgi:hypothetical protein